MGTRKRLFAFYKNAEEKKEMRKIIFKRRANRNILWYDLLPEEEKEKLSEARKRYYRKRKEMETNENKTL